MYPSRLFIIQTDLMIRELKIHQITALMPVPLEMLQGSSIIVVSQIYLCNVF